MSYNRPRHTLEQELLEYRIPELKNILKEMGLPLGGRKKELIERILSFYDNNYDNNNYVNKNYGNQWGGADIDYFMPDANLPENHQKYCRCVLHVSADQPKWCLADKAWRDIREGKQCYNPYAVCTASVGRKGYRDCFKYYNLDNIPEDELVALESLKGKDRKQLREFWLQEREGSN